MTKITNLRFAAITAGTLIALAVGPAFGQPPKDLVKNSDETLSLLEPKTIFVTSMSFTGDLVTESNSLLGTLFSTSEGLAAGDALCQHLADAPGSIVPNGEYLALLSGPGVNANARISPTIGGYVRPDGVPVASDFTALFSTTDTGDFLPRVLLFPPNISEQGVVGPEPVWTGTFPGGNGTGFDCSGWSATDSDGGTGFSGLVHNEWIRDEGRLCQDQLALYCVKR